MREAAEANAEDQAESAFELGKALTRLAEYDAAAGALSKARALCKKAGNAVGEASCIERLGEIAFDRSDDDTARACYEETARARYEDALALYRRIGDVLGEANCMQRLGDIALWRSDHEKARARYEEALQLYRRIEDVLGEANCISSLADIDASQGDVIEARERYQAALSLYSRIPQLYSVGATYRRLARISKDTKERDQYVAAAHKAWQSIDRQDLVADLEREFPNPDEPEPNRLK